MKLTPSQLENRRYWSERANNRLAGFEELGNVGIVEVTKIYEQAYRNIQKDIDSIYDNYSRKGILDTSELKKAIGVSGKNEFLRNIKKEADKLGLDYTKIYDERYLHRLTRLEAILEQIKLKVMTIAPQEYATTSDVYEEVVREGYKGMKNDLSDFGIIPAFSTIDDMAVNAIMTAKWKGANYSERIWNNTGKLATYLQTNVGASFASGESYQKTSRKLRDQFEVSTYEATRLIRTELNFFDGQTELQAYIDEQITFYEFDAYLDDRTSRICRHMNGRIYRTKDAKPGVNFNPMHGHCRSTTIPRPDLTEETANVGDRTDRVRARRTSNGMATTKEERLQRFSEFVVKDEVMNKWKASMQKQMNPNQAVYDYNADMNLVTQDYSNKKKIIQEKFKDDKIKMDAELEGIKKELNQNMDSILQQVPDGYALKQPLENIAKINGWDGELGKYDEYVGKQLQKVNMDLEKAGLNESQKRMIGEAGIVIDPVRSGNDGDIASFSPDFNKLDIDLVNLENMSKLKGDKLYGRKVLHHELGHAFDSYSAQMGGGDDFFSNTQKFRDTVMENKRDSMEVVKIAQKRMSEGITDVDLSKNVREMTPEVYQLMYRSREGITVNGIEFKVPREMYDYHVQHDEIFAEAYSLWHNDRKWLQDNTPKIFDYFFNVTNKKL